MTCSVLLHPVNTRLVPANFDRVAAACVLHAAWSRLRPLCATVPAGSGDRRLSLVSSACSRQGQRRPLGRTQGAARGEPGQAGGAQR